MIIQCSDLERALRTPELMPDARAHAEHCDECRRDLYLWAEISRVAPALHQEWESPALWPRIGARMTAERARRARPPVWQWALAAAALAAVAVALLPTHRSTQPQSREFLTEDALHEVQRAETAYARSIDKLSAVAGPELQRSPLPLAAAYREKLLLLDAAIADLRQNAGRNRYNTYLQTELASLYSEKQKTLQDWLKNAKSN